MHIDRIELLIRYILAAAGQEDEYTFRDLGAIHFIKHIYLADLAFAERNNGTTFTGVPWKFHHFGPWAYEVFERIEPVAISIGATKKVISSAKYDDFTRWSLIDEELFDQLGRELPFIVSNTVKRSIREFGPDTSGLLQYVYATPPMIHAAPEEELSFLMLVKPPHEEDIEKGAEIPLSAKEKKRRKKSFEDLREKVKAKLREKKDYKKRLSLQTPPRYDEIFYNGQALLDSLSGVSLTPQEGEISFSDEVWKSSWRTDFELS